MPKPEQPARTLASIEYRKRAIAQAYLNRAATLRMKRSILARTEADLRRWEAQLRQREQELNQREAQLLQRETAIVSGATQQAVSSDNTVPAEVSPKFDRPGHCPDCQQKVSVWWDTENNRCGFCHSNFISQNNTDYPSDYTREQRWREAAGCCFNCGASKAVWWDTKQKRCSNCGATGFPTPAA